MTPADSVARARAAAGQGCQYALGKGGFRPDRPFPWTIAVDAKLCDCSGFVAWCLNVSRQNPHPAMPWLETTAVYHDAMGPCVLFRHVPAEEARAGDVLVWGDAHGHQGHIGIVTEVQDGTPSKVCHCSRGNVTHTGDAIRETDTRIFVANNAIVARFIPSEAVA